MTMHYYFEYVDIDTHMNKSTYEHVSTCVFVNTYTNTNRCLYIKKEREEK